AVVSSFYQIVNFLEEDTANVIDKDPPGAGLHGEREWVAEAQRPDFAARPGRCDERGVVRDGAGGVEAEDLASQASQRLCVAGHAGAAEANVEFAGGAEVQGGAVVVAVGRGDVVEQDLFTAGDGDVRVGGAGGEAADAVDRRAAVGGVVDVDEVVTGEVWV